MGQVSPPGRIRVDGRTVKVRLKPQGQFPQGYAVGGSYRDGVIELDPNNLRTGLRNSLLHELGHHFCERSGLSRHLNRKMEELVVDELMAWVLSTIRDNPDLVEFLTAEDD